MELSYKLQELRKQKGLTQEELAEVLFVSRAAVSKWESGRGYPNIDSLKAIAKYFGVTMDQLLSGDEILTIAEENTKEKEMHLRDLVFGLLDLSTAMFFFLPLFGQKINGAVQAVSLMALTEIAPYMKVGYYTVVICMIALGVMMLVLQNCRQRFYLQFKSKISLLWNTIGAVLFVISTQPYGATMLLIILAIKVLLLFPKR